MNHEICSYQCTFPYQRCFLLLWHCALLVLAFAINQNDNWGIYKKESIYNKLIQMETYHLEKIMVLPGSFNFHNLCCFVGCQGPIYPLHWWCIDIVWNSFDAVPKGKYLMPKQWDNLVSNLSKVASECVVDVVRHLFLVSRWFNLTTGQTGHTSEGLHAMLEVADKMFLKSIFLPVPQVHRCLLNYSFFQHWSLVIPLWW